MTNIAFYGKALENVGNGLKVTPFEKDNDDKMVRWQSKLTFNGIHKSYENYVTYTFTQQEVLVDKQIYLGYTVLEVSIMFFVRNKLW